MKFIFTLLLCSVFIAACSIAPRRYINPTASLPTNTPKPFTGEWEIGFGTDVFDDSKIVQFSLDAEYSVEGWLDTTTPTLYIECSNGYVNVYINVGMEVDANGGTSELTYAHYRFDKDEALMQTVLILNDGETLDFDDSESMVTSMLHHNEMAFGFTPFHANLVSTIFNLRGLQNAIKPFIETCGWRESTSSP